MQFSSASIQCLQFPSDFFLTATIRVKFIRVSGLWKTHQRLTASDLRPIIIWKATHITFCETNSSFLARSCERIGVCHHDSEEEEDKSCTTCEKRMKIICESEKQFFSELGKISWRESAAWTDYFQKKRKKEKQLLSGRGKISWRESADSNDYFHEIRKIAVLRTRKDI